MPGPNNNSILFVVSCYTSGRMKAIESLTDLDALRRLQEKIRAQNPAIPAYFEMMLEVEGYQETGLKMELRHFFPLSSDFRLPG